MPLTAASSASHAAPSTVTNAATGRAQEPTTQASKKEQAMAPPHRRHARRHEPAASSSSASSSSSSSLTCSRPRMPDDALHPHYPHHPHRSLRLHVGVFSKRKGVRYNADGRVVTCRFCEILHNRDEPFLYEDESLVVFRPLHPIVPSHILIVPRAHIRNVNQLNVDHVTLLRRMRTVADRVLHTHPELQSPHAHAHPHSPHHLLGKNDDVTMTQTQNKHLPTSPNDVSTTVDECPGLTLADLEDHKTADISAPTDCRFAFHVPPFNSIDHVHMHAFRGDTGYVGRIKYRTESWWCRSYDEVLARLELQHPQPQPQTQPHLSSMGHASLVSHRDRTISGPAPTVCT